MLYSQPFYNPRGCRPGSTGCQKMVVMHITLKIKMAVNCEQKTFSLPCLGEGFFHWHKEDGCVDQFQQGIPTGLKGAYHTWIPYWQNSCSEIKNNNNKNLKFPLLPLNNLLLTVYFVRQLFRVGLTCWLQDKIFCQLSKCDCVCAVCLARTSRFFCGGSSFTFSLS